ncbi:MAG: thiamine phosphate synthase [Alphaproteobacteria bacterium]|nr:thiamine phosphate synthase [Alphaproteobacteria bacterium]
MTERRAAAGDSETSTCRLYLVTPEVFETQRFAIQLRNALAGGDVACVRLRLKSASDAVILQAAAVLHPICLDHDVALLVSGRPELAAQSGVDGVHVGREDKSCAEARAAVGAGAIVGVSCHDSRHLAIEAAEAGADYVEFGAFFPPATKTAQTAVEPNLLRWWRDLMELPCVAIGAITPPNCGPLVAAGADFIAASSAIWDDPAGPGAAVAAFNRAIAAALDPPAISPPSP